MKGGLLVLFLGLGISFAPFPPKNFLPTPLELSTEFKNKQKRSAEYKNHKTKELKTANFKLKYTVALFSNISLFDYFIVLQLLVD